MIRTRLLFLALLFAAACGPKDEAPPADAGATSGTATAGSSEDDLADVSEYRLTMDKMDKYFAAQRNIALKVKDLSPAEREAIDIGDANDSLDDMARKMEANPAMRSALREAGMSPREFATHTVSMMQTAMAAGVLQMRPNDNQDSLAREMKASMENIKFFRENEAELTRKQQALEAELRKMGALEPS